VVCVAAGIVWSLLSGASVAEATAWSSWILGTVMLLLGGTSGSGLSRMSSEDYGIHYGRRHGHGFDDTEGEILRAEDLKERLRRGLRPEANPTAFWQVVGGLAVIGFGLAVLSFAA
ncbi:MAG: hypothetical protein HKN01_01655, partial [Acidimicrobiia bacterium]|nr:hypothetical protein [Acidimicrobiia bacterium]